MATYTVVSNTLVSSSATFILKKITIPAISNATYTVKVTLNTAYSSTMPTCTFGGTATTLTNGTASAAKSNQCVLTNVPFGATVEILWGASAGFDLSKNSETITVSDSTALTVTNPTVAGYTVTVPAVTTGIASYKNTITYTGKGKITSGYTSGTASSAITAASSLTVPKTATFKVDWTPTTGYGLSKTTESATNLAAVKDFTNPTAGVIYKSYTIPAVGTNVASYSIKLTKGDLGALPTGYTSGTAKTGITGATTVKVPYGTTIEVNWTPASGYTLNKASQSTKHETTTYTWTSGEAIAAADTTTFSTSVGGANGPTASVSTFTVTVPAVTTGIASYTIKITKGSLGSMPSGYISGTASSALTTQTSVTGVPFGSKVEIAWTATTGYALSKTTDSVASVTAAKTFTNPTASVIVKTVTIPAAPTGTTYQFKVTKGTLGSMPTAKDSSNAAVTVAASGSFNGTALTKQTVLSNVPYGTKVDVTWTVTSAAQYTFNTTKTTSTTTSNATQHTVSNATAHTFSNPTVYTREYKLTVTQGTGTTLTVTGSNGVTYAPSATAYDVPYGTVLTYSTTANTGYENANATAGAN